MAADLESAPKLNGKNSYASWKFEIEMLLQAYKLTKIVDGWSKLEEQTNDKDKEKWQELDGKARKLILHSLHPSQKGHLYQGGKTSCEMMKTLKGIFERDPDEQVMDLLDQFHNFRYDDKKDMLGNISDFRFQQIMQLNANW